MTIQSQQGGLGIKSNLVFVRFLISSRMPLFLYKLISQLLGNSCESDVDRQVSRKLFFPPTSSLENKRYSNESIFFFCVFFCILMVLSDQMKKPTLEWNQQQP